MSKAKAKAKAERIQATLIRWPADWRKRIYALKGAEQPEAEFVRSILRPVLAGEVVLETDEDGHVIGFAPAPKGKRVPLSPAPRQGRPAGQ